jgi:hypothetical protein
MDDVPNGRIVATQAGANVPERKSGRVEQPTFGQRITQIERVREARVDFSDLFLVEKNEDALHEGDLARGSICRLHRNNRPIHSPDTGEGGRSGRIEFLPRSATEVAGRGRRSLESGDEIPHPRTFNQRQVSKF